MLFPGTVLDNTYQIECELGKGGTAVVYLAYHLRLQKYVVLKNILISTDQSRLIRNEVDTLKELHHTALPQVYDFLSLPDGIFTVMDFIDGDDLEKCYQKGRRFSSDELLQFMIEITEVLSYMHKHNPPLLHSDLKPGNVMLRPDGSITLIDFNISVWLGGGILGYTGGYASPEQCAMARIIQQNGTPDFMLDGRSDIYSLGATMYYLLTGVEPAAQQSDQIPLTAFNVDAPVEFLRIIEKCMAWDRDNRWSSAEELLSALRRLRRLGKDFRKKCLMQAGIVLLCGLMIVGGSICVGKGMQMKQRETFVAECDSVISETDAQSRIDSAKTLLNRESAKFDDSPEYKYRVLLAAGDSSLELAENADENSRKAELNNALQYYMDAAELAWQQDYSDKRTVTILCADILTELNDSDRIQNLMVFANEDHDLCIILTAQRTALNGDTNLAMSQLSEIASTLSNRELRWCCYSVMADVSEMNGNLSEAINNLKAAQDSMSDSDTLRKLGQLLIKQAHAETDAQLKQNEYAEAADCFLQIMNNNEAKLTDRVNYATAATNAGDPQSAIAELENLNIVYPQRYEILLELALAYNADHQQEKASAAAEAALQLLSDDEKLNRTDEVAALSGILGS